MRRGAAVGILSAAVLTINKSSGGPNHSRALRRRRQYNDNFLSIDYLYIFERDVKVSTGDFIIYRVCTQTLWKKIREISLIFEVFLFKISGEENIFKIF